MLEEYKFSSESGNILSIFHEGQGTGILVSNAKQLIQEHLGTNDEITIINRNDVKKDEAQPKVNKKIVMKDDELIGLLDNDSVYIYILKKNNITSAETTKYSISCITDASEAEYWTSDEDEDEKESEPEKDNEDKNVAKNEGEDYKKYLDAVDKQKQSFVDETEGVFKISFDPTKTKRINLINEINDAIDDMIKDAKVYKDKRDVAKHYSHDEYRMKDYHPGSDDVVLDIVHPSLFSYISNVTELDQEGVIVHRSYKDEKNSKKRKIDQRSPNAKATREDDDSKTGDTTEAFDMWGRR